MILLQPRSKKPLSRAGSHWYTKQAKTIKRHLESGGNVGTCGDEALMLDFDDERSMRDLFLLVGVLTPTVRTKNGFHVYFLPEVDFEPASIVLNGEVVGQVKRKPSEYCVRPPSVHPSGFKYEWIADATALEPLPEAWREHLIKTNPEPKSSESGEFQRFEIPDSIEKGKRHRTFYRWARSWKAQGYAIEDALDIIKFANRQITNPPMDEDELEREIRRAWIQPDRPEFVR